MNPELYISQILDVFGKGRYYDEIKRAKEQYFSKAFKVAEGSDKYESELNLFFDWFVFERNLEKEELSPIKLFLKDHLKRIANIDSKDQKFFEAMGESFVSAFELRKIRDDEVVIKDLFDKETYIVEGVETTKMFQKSDVFQARLIPLEDRMIFSQAFLFHPKEAKDYLRKQLRKTKDIKPEQKKDLMLRLQLMKHRSEQYPHIDVTHIYSESPVI